MVLLLAAIFLSVASCSCLASISSAWQSWMLASGRHSFASRSLAPSQFRPLFGSWAAILVLLCIPSLVRSDQPQDAGKNLLVDSNEHGSGTAMSALALADEQERVPCEIVVSQPSFVGFPSSSQPSAAASSVVRDHHHLHIDAAAAKAAVGEAAPSPVSSSPSSPKVGIFPPFLEWGDKPLFSPSALRVTISNRCNSTLLRIFPPFSSSVQFYAAAFSPEPLELHPGQEVSLSIVFLPSSLGQAQAVVLLQTSLGGFLLQVRGNGVASPFGLRPMERASVAPGQTLRLFISLDNKADDKRIKVNEARSWPADSINRTLVLTNPDNNEVGVTRCCSSDSSCSCVLHGRDELGSYLSIRPAASWEISPGSSSKVIGVEFNAAESAIGSWNGFVYISLSLFSPSGQEVQVSDEQLVIPFNMRVASQVQVMQSVPEVINFGYLSSRREVRRQAVTLRNTGLESLEIRHISRHTPAGNGTPSRINLVAVRYRKGLVVHPGTQVQVAVAWYQGLEESFSMENDNADSSGLEQLLIHTNSSSDQNKVVRVPFHAVVLHASENLGGENDAERILFVDAGIDVDLSQLEMLERKTFEETEVESGIFSSGQVELTQHLQQQQLVARSSFIESGVIFPAVQVGSSEALWLNLENPSDGAVSVKLFVNQEWEASGCRCSSDVPADCSAREDGKKVDAGIFVLQEGGISEIVLGSREGAELGPLLFRPSKRCTWTGLVGVKNNLTALDWIPVRGTGSSAELKFLENNVPVDSLRLAGTTLQIVSTVTAGIDENLSSLSEKMNSASCKQPMYGSFEARNTGDIPLRVHSVGLMNGECSSQGFELGSCNGFSLAAGEATRIRLSYKSDDFVSSQVRHNNLQLVTSIGTVNVPVTVVLPDHMLRLCANIPVYFKYRALMFYVGFFGLLCTVLVLPAKVGGKKLGNDDCGGDSAMARGLPLFREFTPRSMISEASSSPTNLSKIRVKVREELVPTAQGAEEQQTREGAVAKASSAADSPSVSTCSDSLEGIKQQHSIAMSPVSSPKSGSSKSQEKGGKRKRKKCPVSLVKQEASRSGTSSPSSSSPASPAITALSSQRPVSPLFSSDSTDPSKIARLDVEVGRRMVPSSSSSSSTASSHWVPKDEIASGGRKSSGLKTTKEKAQHPSKVPGSGEWVTVARKSGAEVVKQAASAPTSDAGKRKTLTQSATFPGSSRNSPELQPQISPSARAPGSKLAKNSNGESNTSVLSEINDSGSSSSGCSSRFSGDDMIEQSSCSSPRVDLVYDIWGDHLGDMTRQSKFGGEETQSLFSVPAFTLPSKPDQQASIESTSSSEFSMFSGNEAAPFNRVVAPDEEQRFSSSYFYLSPFDLSYSNRMNYSGHLN